MKTSRKFAIEILERAWSTEELAERIRERDEALSEYRRELPTLDALDDIDPDQPIPFTIVKGED
jgi:hypothetical protein